MRQLLDRVWISILFVLVFLYTVLVLPPLLFVVHARYYWFKPEDEKCLECPLRVVCDIEEP